MLLEDAPPSFGTDAAPRGVPRVACVAATPDAADFSASATRHA
jgi:hypothetical protein